MRHIKSVLATIWLPSFAISFPEQYPLHRQGLTSMPLLGFGTWNLHGDNATAAVSFAIQSGYRHIDCATAYGNQKEVGAGIADGLGRVGLQREDIWVTSKLWNAQHIPPEPTVAIQTTLGDLGLDYLDLWLMHWPVSTDASSGKNRIEYDNAWLAMNFIKRTGSVRHIGVSNFSPAQLQALISNRIEEKPDFHQMEMHPYLHQNEFLRWHQGHGINVTAYSPLANLNPIYHSPGDDKDAPPMLLENTVIKDIAERRDCTPAQVVLAWGMQRGTSVIPKSAHAARIQENYGGLDCILDFQDHDLIGEIGYKFLKRYSNPSNAWGVKLYDGLDGV